MAPSTVEATNHCENENAISVTINNCRLSKLNYDCLEHIFTDLSTTDLIHLCQINPLVCEAIKERAIGKRHIEILDWNQIWNSETIFNEFGAYMRNMTVREWSFSAPGSTDQPINSFLSMLIKYCTPKRIQSLALYFDICALDEALLNAARPFFTELQQIRFGSIGRNPNTNPEQLLTTMVASAKHVSNIQLENTSSNGNWLRYDHMKNVDKLALFNSTVNDESNWHSYFANQPELKQFAWANSTMPNRTLCENVARYCKDLEHFIDFQYFVADANYLERDFVMNRYNYFGSFKKLKCARIMAYTHCGRDLMPVFMALAQQNTVEMLTIRFLNNTTSKFSLDPMATQHYPSISALKKLEIENCSSCGFFSNRIVHFIEQTENLQELTISGQDPINSVQFTCMVLASPQLTVLKINRLNVKNLQRALVSIGTVRAGLKSSEILTVFISFEQRMQLNGHGIRDNIRIVAVMDGQA